MFDRIFDELDKNHDYRISKEEFEFYKKKKVKSSEKSVRSTGEENFQSLFALFDRNGDNFISSHEVRDTMKNLGEQINDQRLEEMMKTADFDRDGRISREEFHRLVRQLFFDR